MSFNTAFCLVVFAIVFGLLFEDAMAQYFTFGLPVPYGGGSPPSGVYGKRFSSKMTTVAEQPAPFSAGTLTQSEAELYDRQIRLWGVEAQNRIRASNVLIVGLSGLGGEVAKNLILAGPRAVTLMDEHEISGNDNLSQFLFTPDIKNASRAEASYEFCRRLNPLVKLEVDTSSLRDKSRQYYLQFDLIVLIDQEFDVIDQADLICREQKIAFIAGGVFGWAGYGFFDFTGREFLITKPRIETATITAEDEGDQPGPSTAGISVLTVQDDEEKVKKVLDFQPFAAAFDVSTKNLKRRLPLLKHPQEIPLTDELLETAYLRELAENSHFSADEEAFDAYKLFTGPQLGAACAILGGFIGQEAIKALSQTGEPLRNVLTYTALDTAYVSNLPPQ
ncbi:ThiF domain-containing protein [Aphelenchoides bicaudatus]|nr:ThiF domain-containing protein [Aphelenchoides bicaudatus]